MRKHNAGRGVLSLVLVSLLVALVWLGYASYTNAAGLTPPIGNIIQRDCQNYALGRIFMSIGISTGTTEVAASGITATDHIVGMVNVSDPSETQIANSALTAATDKVTAASGITNAEYYIVVWVRPLKTGQTSW